jgi:hypothetical protein
MRLFRTRLFRSAVLTALSLALLSTAAMAQRSGRTSRTEEQQRADQDADRAYQNVIRNTDRGQPAQTKDPWGEVRSGGSSSGGNTKANTKR